MAVAESEALFLPSENVSSLLGTVVCAAVTKENIFSESLPGFGSSDAVT